MALSRCPEGHLFSPKRYGKICPYCSKAVVIPETIESLEDGSSPYIHPQELMNPITGWLVCIEGPVKGHDYRIFSQKNFIGSGDSMDIIIKGDNAIEKRNHAIVVYDPKTRKTLLLPGDSKGLVYYNNESIYAPAELQSHDIIEIGKSKFLFIPLCGEHFEWEDADRAPENIDSLASKLA